MLERTNRQITTLGTLAMIGGAALVVGATLLDLGSAIGQPAIEQAGNALGALSGLELAALPFGPVATVRDSKRSSIISATGWRVWHASISDRADRWCAISGVAD